MTRKPKDGKPAKPRQPKPQGYPLFPHVSEEIGGIVVSIVFGADDAQEVDGVLPPHQTEEGLYEIFQQELAAEEIDGTRKQAGLLTLELVAVGLDKRQEQYDIDSRDLTLRAELAPASVKASAAPASMGAVLPEAPPEGARGRRRGKDPVLIPQGSTVLPAGIEGERALAALDARAQFAFVAQAQENSQRVLNDGARMLFASMSDGFRSMMKKEESKDERVQELTSDILRKNKELDEKDAAHAREVAKLEDELANSKRSFRREISKLEDKIEDLERDIREMKRDADEVQDERTLYQELMAAAKEHAPQALQFIGEKMGVKLPSIASNDPTK